MPGADLSPRLVLASRSPRRARMLREAGYRFTQMDPPFHDPPQPVSQQGVTPTEVAADLARRKALSLRGVAAPHQVILAADTICVDPAGGLIGQPAARDEARRMIEAFREAVHEVVTAVALLEVDGDGGGGGADDDPVELEVITDVAEVRFGALGDAALAEYLASGEWRGKAGGYNLFDRQAAGWPIEVAGDATTVVGLPMAKLTVALARRGIVPQGAEADTSGGASGRTSGGRSRR